MAGTNANPLTKMKPKPRTTFSTPGSTGPAPRSENSGNMIAPTTIIPATKHAARKAKRMTKRRPISAMHVSYCRHCEEQGDEAIQKSLSLTLDCFASARNDEVSEVRCTSIRHRHRAQRLPFARRQFFGLRLQLTASGKDVASARRTHR